MLPKPSKVPPRSEADEPTGKVRQRLIKRYENGVSRYALAREPGHTDQWLRVRFARWGVQIRGRSEAQRIRWAQHSENPAA